MKKAEPNPNANRNIMLLTYVVLAAFLGMMGYFGYFLQIKSEEVIEVLDKIGDKIIEEKPGFILCYNHKAGLYMQLGEFEEAARVFKQILKINPKYFRANLGLGILF